MLFLLRARCILKALYTFSHLICPSKEISILILNSEKNNGNLDKRDNFPNIKQKQNYLLPGSECNFS